MNILILYLWFYIVASETATSKFVDDGCLNFTDLRTDSVFKLWQNENQLYSLDGIWYIAAANDSTQPAYNATNGRICTYYNLSIQTNGLFHTNNLYTTTCQMMNISNTDFKGRIDPTIPGLMYQTEIQMDIIDYSLVNYTDKDNILHTNIQTLVRYGCYIRYH
eukprot:500695_1